MAGISGVSETTGIKTRQTCSAREYEQGKRKNHKVEKERKKERKREREKGRKGETGERGERINRDVYIVGSITQILMRLSQLICNY